MMLTIDEWIDVMQGVVAWANVVRRFYLRDECEACGATYHPSDGTPPTERSEWCGHAMFRKPITSGTKRHRTGDREPT